MDRDSIRDLLDRTMRGLVLLIALSGILPATSWAEPLRIWVMHNEPSEEHTDVTPALIRDALERWRTEHGIIIENTVRNLELPTESEFPLASYVIGSNQFLEELAAFQSQHREDGKIALEFIRWDDAYNRISGALAAADQKTSPDVIQIGSTWVASFADAGVLTDISGYFGDDDFFPAMTESARPFGTDGLFAMPWFVDARVLFYNKDLVGSPEALSTWDGFRDACKSFGRRGGINFFGIPTTVNWNLLHNLAPWLWGSGGDIIKPASFASINAHRVAFDSPASMEAIGYLKSLSSAGCVAFPNMSQEMMDLKFLGGEYATVITGPWLIERFGPDWQEKFGMALPPEGPYGSHPFVGGSHLAVSKASGKRGNFERAVKLVRHFASPDVQTAYAEATSFLPANRKALAHYLGTTRSDVFRKALEKGYSYPSIPEWGDVVENDLIRSHIWHIWRDIAHVATDETIANTVGNAASELRGKLIASMVERNAPLMALAFGFLGLGGGGFVLWSRRRYRRTLERFESKVAELKRISAERAILEGKALFLERRSEEQTEALSGLKAELSALGNRSESLRQELGIGRFSIASDGTLSIGGEEIHFDNNRQARHLIEHTIRLASRGMTEVHYLWGYTLFGWDRKRIQSSPLRLFETTIAKINGRLRKIGMPPFLKRTGRKSATWKLLWDAETTIENSDVHRSIEECDAAAKQFSEGSIDSACAHLIRTAELDPKNLEALELARRIISDGTCPERYAGRMSSILKIGERMLSQEIDLLEHGIARIDGAGECGELQSMKDHAEYIRDRLEGIFGEGEEPGKSLLLDEIMNRMHRVREDICRLRSSDETVDHLWAQVVDSRSFTRLLAVPHIQTMVNNFYNEDIQAKEDPRLVQLALISMLSRSSSLSRASGAKDERELLNLINRDLKKQLASLESELGSIS